MYNMSICIVYLASPRNLKYSNYLRFDVLHKSISIVKKVLPFDIIVFHEDYTQEDIDRFPNDIQFVQIDFKGYESQHSYTKRRYGYLMMCRFFCGILQSHPCLQSYTHYMRLDDDSFLMHPLITKEKVLSYLKYDYVYRTTFYEEGHDQTPLHTFTKHFLERSNLKAKKISIGYAPYNNFHISSLSLWRHPLIKDYLNSIENYNGYLGHGFLDANIHAQIIWVLASHANLKIHTDFTFGYRHNYHISKIGQEGLHFSNSISFMPDTDTIEDSKDYLD
jgi:hypothetical protein